MKITTINPFGVLVEPLRPSTHVSELAITSLRELFNQHQIIVLRGFETFSTKDGFADYCERWGEVSLWPFGKVLELIEQDNPKDHIFDNSYMPMHWDGMYRPQVPEYQIFHCVKAPLAGQGGRTTFSNTKLVLESVASEVKKVWQKVTGVYEREMEFYKSKTVSPLVVKHPFKEYDVIRYNEPALAEKGEFVNPPNLQFTGFDGDHSFLHQGIREMLYDPKFYYAHEWQSGDIVIADNFTLLHGREAFVAKSPRHLQRVHVLSDPPLDNPALESHQ